MISSKLQKIKWDVFVNFIHFLIVGLKWWIFLRVKQKSITKSSKIKKLNIIIKIRIIVHVFFKIKKLITIFRNIAKFLKKIKGNK